MNLQDVWQRGGVPTRATTWSIVLAVVLSMAAAVLTADTSYAQDAGDTQSRDWEQVDQDQVLELPSAFQPQSSVTDSPAVDSAATDSTATPQDCTAYPDERAASADANGVSGCSAPNSKNQQASIDATQNASGQGTDTLDGSLGTLQDYQQQLATSEMLGSAGIYQMPLAVALVPPSGYYLPGASVVRVPSRSSSFVPSPRRPATPARIAMRPPRAFHTVPRVIGGFAGFPRMGGFRGMRGLRGR